MALDEQPQVLPLGQAGVVKADPAGEAVPQPAVAEHQLDIPRLTVGGDVERLTPGELGDGLQHAGIKFARRALQRLVLGAKARARQRVALLRRQVGEEAAGDVGHRPAEQMADALARVPRVVSGPRQNDLVPRVGHHLPGVPKRAVDIKNNLSHAVSSAAGYLK